MAARCYLCNWLSVDQKVMMINGEARVVCLDSGACDARIEAAAVLPQRLAVPTPERSEGEQRLLALAERWRERKIRWEGDDVGRALACLVGERVQIVVSITSAIVQNGQVITAPIGPNGVLLAVGDECVILQDRTGRPLLVNTKQILNVEPNHGN